MEILEICNFYAILVYKEWVQTAKNWLFWKISSLEFCFYTLFVDKYSRICSARKLKFLCIFIFAHLQILRFQKPDIWQYKRKTGGRFCENLSKIFLCTKVKKFRTNFRAISRKLRFCAKICARKIYTNKVHRITLEKKGVCLGFEDWP